MFLTTLEKNIDSLALTQIQQLSFSIFLQLEDLISTNLFNKYQVRPEVTQELLKDPSKIPDTIKSVTQYIKDGGAQYEIFPCLLALNKYIDICELVTSGIEKENKFKKIYTDNDTFAKEKKFHQLFNNNTSDGIKLIVDIYKIMHEPSKLEHDEIRDKIITDKEKYKSKSIYEFFTDQLNADQKKAFDVLIQYGYNHANVMKDKSQSNAEFLLECLEKIIELAQKDENQEVITNITKINLTSDLSKEINKLYKHYKHSKDYINMGLFLCHIFSCALSHKEQMTLGYYKEKYYFSLYSTKSTENFSQIIGSIITNNLDNNAAISAISGLYSMKNMLSRLFSSEPNKGPKDSKEQQLKQLPDLIKLGLDIAKDPKIILDNKKIQDIEGIKTIAQTKTTSIIEDTYNKVKKKIKSKIKSNFTKQPKHKSEISKPFDIQSFFKTRPISNTPFLSEKFDIKDQILNEIKKLQPILEEYKKPLQEIKKNIDLTRVNVHKFSRIISAGQEIIRQFISAIKYIFKI